MNNSLYSMIDNIVQVVFNTYYNYIKEPELKKDLIQTGFYKAYELLNNGNYDPSMSLRNFIYTGVRNEMHNYLYHENKIQTVDLDILDKYDNIVGYHETGNYNIESERVKDICNSLIRSGNYFPYIMDYLSDIKVIENNWRDTISYNKEERINIALLDSVKALVLWELYEFEVNNG